MSAENNKPIIKKAQELLESYGHRVKTGHLYEIFSKLANEPSWNVANSKETSFLDKVINKAIVETAVGDSLMTQAKNLYIKSLQENSPNKEVTLGMLVKPYDGGPPKLLTKKMELEPNALFVGAMGSGKSIAMSSTLFNYIQKNKEQTLMFIIDPLKGANDYRALFDLPKVFPVINADHQIHQVLTLVYDEILARRDEFYKVQADNINDYEKKTGKKLDRIILAMEEFHAIPYAILNFDKDFKTPGTSAFKLHQILRVGRSLGVWMFAASQKATKSDIPPEIIPNFTQKQVFRVSKAEAVYLLSDTKASEIRSDQKGLCETDYGTVQFPMFTIEEQKKALSELACSDFNNITLNASLISEVLSGDPDKIYSSRKLSDYVKEIQHYDFQLVLKRLHEEMNHDVQLVNSKTDSFGLSLMIEWPNKGKVAVLCKDKISAKHIDRLAKAMEVRDCKRGIIYTLAKDLPAALYKWAIERNIEIVDYEDLLQLAIKIENKE